jgi:hypothetical protein
LGDYNSFVAILDLLDWKTGFFGLISGLVMIFFGADVWTPQCTVLAGLVAAACLSLIVIAFRIVAVGRPTIVIGDQAKMHGEVVDRERRDETDTS